MGKACLKAMHGMDLILVPLSKAECDITDLAALSRAFDVHRPSLVINTAAFTNVDASETDRARATQSNGVAPGYIAQLCARYHAMMIHLSTDYVFGDDGSPPLNEVARPNPINHYGHSKLDGEVAIRSALNQHIILRTSWVFSSGASNFFKTIMTLSERLDTIGVVSDEISCPTFGEDLAQAIGQVALRCIGPEPIFGTWHACGREGLSRFDFAAAIMDARQRAGAKVASLTPTTQSAFGAAATRPKDSRMACDALYRDFGINIPSFRNRLDASVKAMLVATKDDAW
jgi:dTDP-4-dehydrorhamnose reductase